MHLYLKQSDKFASPTPLGYTKHGQLGSGEGRFEFCSFPASVADIRLLLTKYRPSTRKQKGKPR
jgi:hypothetical protein